MKDKKKCHIVLVLTGLLYTFCLFQVLGISVNEKNWVSKEAQKDTSEETKDKVQNKDYGAQGESPRIAITFDDGPSSTCTGRLLDGLKERGVKATFFLIGENAEKNPELVKRMSEEGHLIGNHTYHHVDISRVSDEKARREIMQTNEVIYSITGKGTEYMRPPFGELKEKLEKELDVFSVMWSIDPLDWTTENVDEIVNKVVTQAGENDIILLHDCYDSSVDAALRIVDILKKKGFEFVTADQMIQD